MIKWFTIFFFLLLFSRLVSAQNDSILHEIENAGNSKSVLISKGRALLLDKFLSMDMAKTAELDNYLSTALTDNDYVALFPIEQWLIEFWTRDYQQLMDHVRHYEAASLALQGKVAPQPDNLYAKLREKSYAQRQSLTDAIRASSLTDPDKDFLFMLLNSCLVSGNTPDITQDLLNAQADHFISMYPYSEWILFTRTYIRYKLVVSDWGFTFEFFSGYGWFTGDLKTHFANNVPLGVAFDIYYKKFALYLRDYIGFSSTKHTFNTGPIEWNKHSQVRVYLPEASVGYVINDGKRFKIAPFAGISSTDITPTDYDLKQNPDLKNYELKFTTTYTLGLNVDIKLGKPHVSMAPRAAESGYWFLRVRYAYNFPQFAKSYTGYDGNMQYITIGLGGFASKIKRDHK